MRAATVLVTGANGEIGHGPWCLGLPDPRIPVGYTPLEDGSDLDNPGHR